MEDKNAQNHLEIGTVWIHVSSGGRYEITNFHEGADKYGTSGHLIDRVGYVQLEDGEKRKAGSPYSRSVEDFLQNFEKSEK